MYLFSKAHVKQGFPLLEGSSVGIHESLTFDGSSGFHV